MFSRSEQPMHIGVITPFLQGDYMGEITNQIRYICETKHYQFSAIRTDSFGHYNLPIGLDQLAGVIVLRNAANPKLIEKIQNRGTPVIAIAHDYFPLDVPVVTCNNSLGAELAFEFLTSKGHKELMYVGDITQYDLRKRYERFSELQKEHNLPYGNEQIICAPDSIFSGGLAAGEQFLQKASRCTGIFCGAGNTGMGFITKLEECGIRFPGDLDVVAFDAIRAMHVLTPQLSYIDQNLDVLAKRCITVLEGMIHSKTTPTTAITIAPTLCAANPERNLDLDTYAKESHTESILKNTRYTGSLLNHSIEMTQDIVYSRLDKIMSVAPLFSQFMNFGILSCVVYDRHKRTHLHTYKIFENTQTICIAESDEDHTCLPEAFPPPAIRAQYNQEWDSWVHFPIFREKELWGVLSLAGARDRAHSVSSFSSFTCFIDNIAFGYALLLENHSLREQLKQSEAASPKIGLTSRRGSTLPSFEWDLEKGSVIWSDLALELLGFTTELEKNIYRSMEIFDRVHPDDDSKLRKELTSSLSNLGNMTTAARLKNAEGEYCHYSFQGEIMHEVDARAVSYRCCLSLIN
ncbi:substrate-binding domain-containing protein [Teredinibacter haidensis]|uniref:substrate-binding domain-containing protein n=1 Tax=Teredinibacter haidensis TaxID=2731755 RepID=UPI000948C85D|nr:substrate-binding domain-containing protein [Teredinibacter haidensis]